MNSVTVILALLMSVDPQLPSKQPSYWLSFGLRTLMWSCLIGMGQYLLMPAYVGPFGGLFVLTMLLVATIRFAVWAFLFGDESRSRHNLSISGSNMSAVEWFVVVAIVLILVALLLPAVQAARRHSTGEAISVGVDAGGVLLVLLMFLVGLVLDGIATRWVRREHDSENILLHFAAAGLTIVVALGIWVNSWTMWRPAHYRSLIGEVASRPWEETIENPSEEHIRAISEEQALWKMGQALKGTTGTLFHAGYAYHQRLANGKSYWVAPLVENNPTTAWFQRTFAGGNVPFPSGYVICSSENPMEEAQLVDKIGDQPISLRYTTTASFGHNVIRHLYKTKPEVQSYVLRRWTFELDKDGRPFYIAALCRPTVCYSGEKVEKYAMVDPQTGDCSILDKVPDWVDNPMPTELLHSYIAWWGNYPKSIGDGWWDHFTNFAGKDTLEAGSKGHRLTWDSKGEPHIFTSITSQSNRDSSTKSYLLYNPRTGEVVESEAPGQTEKAVLEAVDGVVKYQHRHGTVPTIFNIYGHRTWVVPVSSENNAPMGIALVDKDVRGNVVYNTDKRAALAEWRQYLAKNNADVVPSATTKWQTLEAHTIMVRQVVNDRVYFRLKETPNVVFVISVGEPGFEQAAVSLEGEQVDVTFLGFGDNETSVQTFRNRNMGQPAAAEIN